MEVDHTQVCHRDNEKMNRTQMAEYTVATKAQYPKVEAMAFLLFESVKRVYFTEDAALGGFN